MKRDLAILVALLMCGSATLADDWPQFRGPTGLGITPEKNLPITWGGPQGENILWRSPILGEGHSSPIVWNNRVILSTVRWPFDASKPAGKPDPKIMPEHHVLCYSVTDGKLLWDTKVEPGPWLRDDFRSGAGGGYAAPTPVTDGEMLFVVFGSSVMAAIKTDGKIAWRQEIKPFTFDVTIGSSPVLYGDTVILLMAMAKKSDSRLAAFSKADGKLAWETKLPGTGFAHSTPLLLEVKGKQQLITIASGGGSSKEALQSFEPVDGKRLWWCKAAGDASSPAYGSGILYVDSGRGGEGTAVDPTGEGDVGATHVKWTTGSLGEAIGSPVIVDGHVVRLQAGGVVKVWKAADGEETDKQRLQGLGSSWASPIVDGNNRIYFANGGKSYVVQAGPKLKLLATNDLNDANHSSPAVSNGRLFIAGLRNLYCIGSK